MAISPQRREEILDALRRGTVPSHSLDAFAVGLDRLAPAMEDELRKASSGGSVFKAVRGEYGCGKTFFARWLADRARQHGLATSEVQISETETPLYRLETVYRRLMERLSTADTPTGALRNVIDAWLFTLEQDVLAAQPDCATKPARLLDESLSLLEQRLATISRAAPAFSAALRGYRRAQIEEDRPTADALLAWLAGQPNVAADAKRRAGIKGEIDHFAALTFVQGMLTVLRDAGHPGWLVVLDEVETVQRMRSDVRDKSLNALRQLIDEIDAGRFPGLFLLVTGTPAFFEGPQGVQRLEPLAQRLGVDFQTDARFDNPRAVQLRLPAFDSTRLCQVGHRIRDIYLEQTGDRERMLRLCSDAYVVDLAAAVTGKLGGKTGVAPRLFLKKLVADVLDRIDQHPDFDPRQHYALTINASELTAVEREAAGAQSVDEVPLDL